MNSLSGNPYDNQYRPNQYGNQNTWDQNASRYSGNPYIGNQNSSPNPVNPYASNQNTMNQYSGNRYTGNQSGSRYSGNQYMDNQNTTNGYTRTNQYGNQNTWDQNAGRYSGNQYGSQRSNLANANNSRYPNYYGQKNVKDYESPTTEGDSQGGKTLAKIFLVLALINLIFIIPNLIFAYQDNACVTTHVPGIAFTLGTWLKVDAYIRIVLLIFLLVAAIIMCVNKALGEKIQCYAIIVGILYIIFGVAWLMVGSYMYFERLKPQGVCNGGVGTYMNIIVGLGAVLFCCSGMSQYNNNTRRL